MQSLVVFVAVDRGVDVAVGVDVVLGNDVVVDVVQALVVQTLDSAIHRINDYPADKY